MAGIEDTSTDPVAWIVGASSGVGLACAHELARAGFTLALSARGADQLSHTLAQLPMNGRRHAAYPMDVRDGRAVTTVVERIGTEIGAPRVLVNSAGINTANRTLACIEARHWDDVIATNLTGAFHCVRAVLPAMRRQGDGLILNIGSWASRFVEAIPGPAYTAAKHGLLGLTASINLEEYSNGIRASTICPAEIRTPLMESRAEALPASRLERMLRPADVARVVAFIASLPATVCINEVLMGSSRSVLYERPGSAASSGCAT